MFKNSQGYTIVYFNTDAFQTLAMVVAEFTSDLELHGMLNFSPPGPSGKGYFSPYSITKDFNNNYYVLGETYDNVVGSSILSLIKFDSTWDVQWGLKFEESSEYLTSQLTVLGDNILFLVYDAFSNIDIFLNVSPNGVLNSAYVVDGVTLAFGSPLILKTYGDNIIYIVGRALVNRVSNVLVAKVNSKLGIQWAKLYSIYGEVFDLEVVGDRVYIVGYESEESAFIAEVDGASGNLVFYKVFYGENHYSYRSLDLVVNDNSLYVYGEELNSTGLDCTNDWDSFIAKFSLSGDLEKYVVISRSTIETLGYDELGGLGQNEILLVDSGRYVLASLT
ncbi:MAG: hypothetical protein B6U76_06855 [Desulfurococcales archaeon ex4484_217_2]|nr:MAG: hypothetical protein B6U76_06855 [Desulfurococcales archaeon ex4484_217_2]